MLSSKSTATTGASHHLRHRSRQVGFNSRTQVYLVPSLSEYTDDELEACFTTEQDTKRNQGDIVRAITDARTHGINAEGICIRGLEYMVNPQTVQERKIAKERHYDAILDEQDRQWDAGVFPTDCDSIAEESLRTSQESRDRAQMMGAKDAVAARRIRRADDEEEAANRRRSSVVSLSGTAATTTNDDEVATATSTAVAANLRGHRRSSSTSTSGVPTSSSSPESVPSLDKMPERVNLCSGDGQQANQNVAN